MLHAVLLLAEALTADSRPAPPREAKKKVRASTSLPRRDLSTHRPEVGCLGFYYLGHTIVKGLSEGYGSVATPASTGAREAATSSPMTSPSASSRQASASDGSMISP